jgi:large subunit ribosomal protein L22
MARAFLKGFRESPRRVRMVAEMIRGKKAEDALAILAFQPRKAAKMLTKVLNSAIANATENDELDADALVVTKVEIDGGPIQKRWLPRSMGRANRLNRRTSHVDRHRRRTGVNHGTEDTPDWIPAGRRPRLEQQVVFRERLREVAA